MPQLTIAFGAALILTGVVTYFATGRESVTSLIPAVAGIPVVVAGIAATRAEWRSYGLYVAAGLVLLLALGTLRGVTALVGGDVTTGSVVNSGLLVASVLFLIVLISSLRGESQHQRAD